MADAGRFARLLQLGCALRDPLERAVAVLAFDGERFGPALMLRRKDSQSVSRSSPAQARVHECLRSTIPVDAQSGTCG